jgi:hypothetical protein
MEQDRREHAHIQFRIGPEATEALDELVKAANAKGIRCSRGLMAKMVLCAALQDKHKRVLAGELMRLSVQLHSTVTDAAAEALVDSLNRVVTGNPE